MLLNFMSHKEDLFACSVRATCLRLPWTAAGDTQTQSFPPFNPLLMCFYSSFYTTRRVADSPWMLREKTRLSRPPAARALHQGGETLSSEVVSSHAGIWWTPTRRLPGWLSAAGISGRIPTVSARKLRWSAGAYLLLVAAVHSEECCSSTPHH